VAPRSRTSLLAGVGAGLAIGVCVIGVIVGVANRNAATPTPIAAIETTPMDAPPIVRVVEKTRPAQERPDAQAKPGAINVDPRVKPAAPPETLQPVEIAKSAVKPTPQTEFYEPPTVKPPQVVPPPGVPLTLLNPQAAHLEQLLRDVPQVDLDPDYARKSKEQIAKFAAQIRADSKDDQDKFIVQLKKTRPELAGMPFLLGKDCQTKNEDAQALAAHSIGIRSAMALAMRESPRTPSSAQSSQSTSNNSNVELFWNEYLARSNRSSKTLDNIPALKQIILAESRDHRMHFVKYLSGIKGERTSAALAHVAVFDLDSQVRTMALNKLYDRNRKEYSSVLIKGLRYPWAPIARHAAEAIMSLNLQDSVPELAAMLDEPDPAAPYVVKPLNEKPKTMVRELVRVNHHRNCLLCHAPSDSNGRNLPVGPVTSMQESLPPSSSVVYYAPRSGSTLVRADVTYLRQDFSVMQEVEDSGKWPQMQRFDFFIRSREMSESEAIARKMPAGAISEYHGSVLAVLRGLTGQDHPVNTAAWLRAIKKQ